MKEIFVLICVCYYNNGFTTAFKLVARMKVRGAKVAFSFIAERGFIV